MHDLEVLIARSGSIQSSPGASTLKISADLDRLVRRLEPSAASCTATIWRSACKLLTLCDRLIENW